MTAPTANPGMPLRVERQGLGLRIATIAAGLVLVAAGLALGFVPAGSRGVVLCGAGLALGCSLVGLILQLRAVATPPGHPLSGTRLILAMSGGLLVAMAVVAISLLALSVAGMKFEFLAAFGLAYAGAALLFQWTSAVCLARALRQGTATAAGPSDSRTAKP